jgi:chloramphenicol 3-O-phosphotransferase
MSEPATEAIEHHAKHLSEMSRPGGCLHHEGTNSTTANPDWFDDGNVAYPTAERARFHRRLLTAFRDQTSAVLTDRKAIVLAGPPGAGKSTVLSNIVKNAGSNLGEWRVIDADAFKDILLREALDDGTYESWILPSEVKQLQRAGERFYPRELAALVHEESSYLARLARNEAINAGERIVIDTVLSSAATATAIRRVLEAAEYEIIVVEVEVSLQMSRERTRTRWADQYIAAERGDAEAQLGGRWVPSEYPDSLFPGGQQVSTCLKAAEAFAEGSPAVSRFERYFVDKTGSLQLDQVKLHPADRGTTTTER